MKKTIINTLLISLLLIKVGALYSRSLIRPLLPPMVKPAVLPRICYIQRVPVYIPVPVESMAPVRRTSQTIVSRGRFSDQLPKLAARKNSQSKVEQKNPVQPNIYTTLKPPTNITRTEQKRVEDKDEDTEAVTDTKLSNKMTENMVVHGVNNNDDDDDDDNLGYANYNQEMKKYVKDLSYINDNAKELGRYEMIPVKNIDNGKDISRGDGADYNSVPQQSYRMINELPNAKTQRFLSNIISVNDNNFNKHSQNDDNNGDDDSNENAVMNSSINKYNSDDSDKSAANDSVDESADNDSTEIDTFVEEDDDKSESVEESGDKRDSVEEGDDKSESVEESGDKRDSVEEDDDKSVSVEESGDKRASVEKGGDKSEGVKEDDDKSDNVEESGDKSDRVDGGDDKSEGVKEDDDKSDNVEESGDKSERVDEGEEEGDDKSDRVDGGDDKSEGVKEDDGESVEESADKRDSVEEGDDKSEGVKEDDDRSDNDEEGIDESDRVDEGKRKSDSAESGIDKSGSIEENGDKSDSVEERRDTNNTVDDDDSKSDSMEGGYGISNSEVEDGGTANNVGRGGDTSDDISKSEEEGDDKNDSIEEVEFGSDSIEDGDNENGNEEKRNMQGRDYNQMVSTYLSKTESDNEVGVDNHNKMISNWLSGDFQPIENNPLGVNRLINILRPISVNDNINLNQLNQGYINTDDMDMDDVEIRTFKRPVINILGLSTYRGIVLGNNKNKQRDQNAGSSQNSESSANNGAFDDSAKGKASDQSDDSRGEDGNRDLLSGDQKESMQSKSKDDSKNNVFDEKLENNNIVQTFGVSQDKLKNYTENNVKGNYERDDVTNDDSNSRDNVKIDNSIDDMTNSFNDSVNLTVNSKENIKGDSLSKQYVDSADLPIQLSRFQFEELMKHFNALNTKMNSIPRRTQDELGENERADEMNYSATNYLGNNFARYPDMFNGEGFDLDLSYDQRKPDTKVNNTGPFSALKSSPTAFMDIKNKNMKTIGISYILPSQQSKNTNTHERYDTAVKLRAKGFDVRRDRKILNVTKLRSILLTSTAPTVVEIPDVKPTQFIYRTTSAVNVLPSVPTTRMMRYSKDHDTRLGLRSLLDDRYYPYSG